MGLVSCKCEEKAYAKINLMLDVISKRDDGYHDLVSVMQSVSLHDDVIVSCEFRDKGTDPPAGTILTDIEVTCDMLCNPVGDGVPDAPPAGRAKREMPCIAVGDGVPVVPPACRAKREMPSIAVGDGVPDVPPACRAKREMPSIAVGDGVPNVPPACRAKREMPSIAVGDGVPNVPLDSSNTAYKAARLFKDYYFCPSSRSPSGLCPDDLNIKIHIVKRIPVAAGLGGGSADAAAVLRALWKIFCSFQTNTMHCESGSEVCALPAEIINLAFRIGADVPFCLVGGTAIVEGAGEIVTPLNGLDPNTGIVLVNPGLGVSTANVFGLLDNGVSSYKDGAAERRKKTEHIVDAIKGSRFHDAQKEQFNLLEAVTLSIHPEITEIKQRLIDLGALYALMSGSGPTVFAIFNSEAETAAIKGTPEMSAAKAAVFAMREAGYWACLCHPVVKMAVAEYHKEHRIELRQLNDNWEQEK